MTRQQVTWVNSNVYRQINRHPIKMNPLYIHKNMNLVMHFGKYNGRSIAWIAEHDPRYLMWLGSLPVVRTRHILWSSVRGQLLKILQAELDAEYFGDLA